VRWLATARLACAGAAAAVGGSVGLLLQLVAMEPPGAAPSLCVWECAGLRREEWDAAWGGAGPSETDAELAQKLGQLQPFMAVFSLECMGKLAYLGQPSTILARQAGPCRTTRRSRGASWKTSRSPSGSPCSPAAACRVSAHRFT
jgi:hypothetical protein